MMNGSVRPNVPRAGRRSSANVSESGRSRRKSSIDDVPPPGRWQTAQFAWRYDRARAPTSADASRGSTIGADSPSLPAIGPPWVSPSERNRSRSARRIWASVDDTRNRGHEDVWQLAHAASEADVHELP